MIKYIVIVAVLAWLFYKKFYTKWSYYGKFIFKAVLLCLTAVPLMVMLVGAITMIPDVYEGEKDKQVPARLESMEGTMNDGRYYEVADRMELFRNYEEEFDYVWERLQMYACYNHYVMYERALEREPENKAYAEELEQYKTRLYELCRNPEFAENDLYAEHYIEEAGLE